MDLYFGAIYTTNFFIFNNFAKKKKRCTCTNNKIIMKMSLFFNIFHIIAFDKMLHFLSIKDENFLYATQVYISTFFIYLYLTIEDKCKLCSDHTDIKKYIKEIPIEEEKICHICLENFDTKNKPYIFYSCFNDKHPFHFHCLEELFKYSKLCPVCKKC